MPLILSISVRATCRPSRDEASAGSWAASSTSVLIAARGFFSSCESVALSCSMSRARASARSTISSRARASWAALSPICRVMISTYLVCHAPPVASPRRRIIQYAGWGTAGPNQCWGRIAIASSPAAMPASTVFDARDQPLATTRPENGMRTAGTIGLRIPPVNASANSNNTIRGVMHQMSLVHCCRGVEAIVCASVRSCHR